MKRHKMPKHIFIYVCDELEDGTPVFAVATELEQVPEENSGQRIGSYALSSSPTFVVTRDLA